MDGLFYLIAGGLLTASFFKDRQKTKKALIKAYNSFMKNLFMLVGMMVLMGVVLA